MRISELLDLHYHDLDLHEGRVNVRRLKNGFSTIHPLRFDEREAIERWSLVRAGWKAADKTDALFISRRGTALSRQQAYRIIRSAGKMRVPSRTLTPICCVTPAAMNWLKEGQIRV